MRAVVAAARMRTMRRLPCNGASQAGDGDPVTHAVKCALRRFLTAAAACSECGAQFDVSFRALPCEVWVLHGGSQRSCRCTWSSRGGWSTLSTWARSCSTAGVRPEATGRPRRAHAYAAADAALHAAALRPDATLRRRGLPVACCGVCRPMSQYSSTPNGVLRVPWSTDVGGCLLHAAGYLLWRRTLQGRTGLVG